CYCSDISCCFFFFQAEDGIRDFHVTGVQTCALPILQSGDAFGFRLGFSLLLALGFLSGAAASLFLTLARLLGGLALGFFLGGLLFGLFLGQSSGRLGTPCLFSLLPFDLLSLPSFLGGLLFLGSALRCGGRLALFGLTLLLGLTLLFSGARGLLFLLALLLLL